MVETLKLLGSSRPEIYAQLEGEEKHQVALRGLAMMSPPMRSHVWGIMASQFPRDTDPTVFDLFQSAGLESDRGFVLVSAAIVDNACADLLIAFFKERSQATDAEVDFWLRTGATPPLQSTALKLRMAAILGLTDRATAKGCLALQKLRSTVAAHTRENFSLKRRDADNIAQLIPVGGIVPYRAMLNSDWMKSCVPSVFLTWERAAFFAITSILMARLEMDLNEIKGKTSKIVTPLENLQGEGSS